MAKSLGTLFKQVNDAYPNRSKSSDGTIGNAEHAARSSDHNPWVKDGGMGVVTAIDITHDPKNGFDSYKFAEMLRAQRDPRIKYIISNKKICSSTTSPWQWRKYTGSNPHDHHVHISVLPQKAKYDNTDPWALKQMAPDTSAPAIVARPALRKGSKETAAINKAQQALKIGKTGKYDATTETAVIEFQKAHGLVPDGVVGKLTWDKLLEAAK